MRLYRVVLGVLQHAEIALKAAQEVQGAAYRAWEARRLESEAARAVYVRQERLAEEASERAHAFAVATMKDAATDAVRERIAGLEAHIRTLEGEAAQIAALAFDQDSGPGEAPTPFEAVANLRARAEAIDERAKAYERDWYAAKSEFGTATSELRELETEKASLRAELELKEAELVEARATIDRQREAITTASATILTTSTVAEADAWSGVLASLYPKKESNHE